MKNLVLALLLALGVSTVANAATEVAAVEADLEQIVQDAEVAHPGLINWVKNNPVKFSAAVLATAAAVTYGVFVAKNYTKFDKDVAGTGFAAALKAPAENAWAGIQTNAKKAGTTVKGAWDDSLATIKANPKTSVACGVGAAILVAVLVDLMNKDGYIRTACSSANVNAVEAAVANEIAAVAAN